MKSSVGEREWGEACDEGVALGRSTDNSALGTALKAECKVQYYVCVLVGDLQTCSFDRFNFLREVGSRAVS